MLLKSQDGDTDEVFVFKMSLLRNYRVKYCDYVVKWCSGIACDWCASLDMSSSLALNV